jgi:hypothetical protein
LSLNPLFLPSRAPRRKDWCTISLSEVLSWSPIFFSLLRHRTRLRRLIYGSRFNAVLRLSKPTFGIGTPISVDRGDLPGALRFSATSFNQNNVEDTGSVPQKRALLSSGLVTVPESHSPAIPGVEGFGLSEFLALPATFGYALLAQMVPLFFAELLCIKEIYMSAKLLFATFRRRMTASTQSQT